MLPAGGNLPVNEFKDDTAVKIQALAVAHPAVVMNADYAAFIFCENVPQQRQGPWHASAAFVQGVDDL